MISFNLESKISIMKGLYNKLIFVLLVLFTLQSKAQQVEKNHSKQMYDENHHELAYSFSNDKESKDRLRNNFVLAFKALNINENEFANFFTFLEADAKSFFYDLNKLLATNALPDFIKVDELFLANSSLFSDKYNHFKLGIQPNSDFLELNNGSEINYKSSNVVITPTPLPTLAPNGPCENTGFQAGNTSGWSGSYGSSSISVNGLAKTCAGFFDTYDPATDECCPLFGSCSPWTPADGYMAVNQNNPNQTVGFNSAANNTATNAATAGVHTVMTAGFDPIVPGNALSVVPPNGSNSIRLGSANLGYNAQALRQTFLVTDANKNFIYHFAAVLNDPQIGHEDYELPFLKIRMYDASNNPIGCASLDVSTANAATSAGFVSVTGTDGQPLFWKNWTSITVPLNPYMGQNVTIEFITSNCTQSGHYGYAYISAECNPQQVVASSPAICGGQSITLTAPPGLNTYAWTGPGIISGQGTPTIVVGTPGNYHVDMTTLTTPPFVPCTFSIDTLIPGNPIIPRAIFSSTTVCKGSPTVFTDASTPPASITAWEWDFNNDGIVDNTNQNPTYIFTSSATFPVTLTSYSGGCSHDTTINVTVTPGTNANFTSTTVCQGVATMFNDISTPVGTVNTWNWDFDNNGTIDNTTQNPTYTFPAAGTYPVKLQVAGTAGACPSDTIINVVVNPNPVASFTATNVCLNSATTFTDGSTVSSGSITSWAWDFDNNTTTDNTTQNPSNLYSSAGTYPVNLTVTTNNTCTNSFSTTVDVFANPVANFSTNIACENFATTFTDVSTNGTAAINSWQWDFDNNTTIDNSTQNPTYTYSADGTYPVTLIVSDANSCKDTTTINVTVTPGTNANFTSTTVCQGVATMFNDISTPVGTVNTWNWDFDNNGTIDNTTQNPTYTFPAAGTYPVKLQVAGTAGACPSDTIINVVVNPNPVASFTATNVCLNSATTFTDGSTVSSGSITSWAWDFDNNTTTDNTTQNPSHSYASAGTYTVNLTVTTNNTCTNSYSTTVDVFANPVANFSTNIACENFATTFTDLSANGTAAINSWQWDFDNNTTIDNSTQNPTYTYSADGTYPVTLIVSDANSCNDTTTINVTVAPQPTAAFGFTNVCFGTTTTFTDLSVGNGGTINQWGWDFTNNGVVESTTQNPTNGYAAAGSYTVELLVTTTNGCKDSITRVVVVNPIPVANFTATTECLGNTTTFTDASNVSTGVITDWAWNFGDASGTSTTQSPTYTYAANGMFNAILTVTSDSGCINNYNTNIDVYSNPVASFTSDIACLNSNTSFTDTSVPGDNSLVIWSWDFDNNGSVDNSLQNPGHVFPISGTQNVNLYIEDSHGCNDDTTITVTVSENPIANYSHTIECFGTANSFTDLSNSNGGTTNIDTWQWDFDGNGTIDNSTQNPTFVFTAAGTYQTELFVTSTLGCKDSITFAVVVNPIPVANFTATNVCLEFSTTFTNTSSVSTGTITQNDWDFADGSGTSTLLSPTYTYGSSGTYNVNLTVTSDSGCVYNVTIPVIVYPKPTADFTVTNVCKNVAAQFTNQSVGNGGTINQWSWDFTNNGSTDNTTQNPTNLYATDGTFNIQLISSTTNGCKDTIVKPVTIYPMPNADFTYVNACYQDGVQFTSTSSVTSGTIGVWTWNFGDGQVSALQNPIDDYASEGLYNVQLIVTTNNSCKDTIVKNGIEVWPLPVVDFIPTTVCLNNVTQFTDQSTISNLYTANNNVGWTWDFADGTPFLYSQNPTHAYTTEGVFQATLVVTSNHNCVDSVTLPVTVNPLPVVDFTPNLVSGCTPVCVTFTDNTTIASGNVTQWDWDFNGDGIIDQIAQNPSNCFINPSHSSVRGFDITLTATSQFGCTTTLTKLDYIHSYPIPMASFSFWPNESTIVDKELTFTDQSIIASTWNWDLGDGSSSTMQNPVHEFTDTGFYLVTLAIENVYGCRDTTQKYIQVKPIFAIYIPNAFTPNGDFTNDYFYVNGYGIKELHVMIFDRWGLKIYDDIGLDQFWDGFYKGNLAQTDIYVYKIRAKDIFDEWHDYIGKVSLLK